MENLFKIIKAEIDHVSFLLEYCPANSLASGVCHNFWLYTVLIPISLAIIYLLWVLFYKFRTELALKQLEKRRLAREQIADSELLDQLKWKGLDSDVSKLSQEELAEKLRSSIKSSS